MGSLLVQRYVVIKRRFHWAFGELIGLAEFRDRGRVLWYEVSGLVASAIVCFITLCASGETYEHDVVIHNVFNVPTWLWRVCVV